MSVGEGSLSKTYELLDTNNVGLVRALTRNNLLETHFYKFIRYSEVQGKMCENATTSQTLVQTLKGYKQVSLLKDDFGTSELSE